MFSVSVVQRTTATGVVWEKLKQTSYQRQHKLAIRRHALEQHIASVRYESFDDVSVVPVEICAF